MHRHISYTAAYAEMTRYVLEGTEALRLRRTEAALAALERAATLAGAGGLGPAAVAGTRLNLAIAYVAAGRLEEAEALYRELLAGDLPHGLRARALHGLGTALAQMDRPEATATLEEAMRLYGTDSEGALDRLLCCVDLAEHRLRQGDPARGYQDLTAALAAAGSAIPDEVRCRAHLTLARLSLALGDAAQAAAHHQAASALLPPARDHILHSLCQAVAASLSLGAGNGTAARRQAAAALEAALVQADLDEGEMLRAIAEIFHHVATAGDADAGGEPAGGSGIGE